MGPIPAIQRNHRRSQNPIARLVAQRTLVTDGRVRLTLWQVDHKLQIEPFDRRKNVSVHHLALTVDAKAHLDELAQFLSVWPGVKIEFMPELVGPGPRKHMMLAEPGGIRLEFIWVGS